MNSFVAVCERPRKSPSLSLLSPFLYKRISTLGSLAPVLSERAVTNFWAPQSSEQLPRFRFVKAYQEGSRAPRIQVEREHIIIGENGRPTNEKNAVRLERDQNDN